MKRAVFILFLLCFCSPLLSQIINIESKRFLKDTNGFAGTISANFNINQNTQQVLTFGLNQHLQYKINRHRILCISDIAFIKAGEQDFVNAGYQHLRYNYKVISFLTWEAFVQAQYNKVLLLDRRYLAGTGPRFRVVKKEKVKVYTAALYMYEYQAQNSETIQQYNHRISAYVTLSIALNKFEFTSTTFFQPNLANIEDHRVANDSSLDLPISKNLNFRAGFNLLYDTRQPPGIPEMTYVLRNGLSYKF